MYYFGQRLDYTPPGNKGAKTLCVFIRDEDGKAVVIFEHAEWVARANYKYLSRHVELRGIN